MLRGAKLGALSGLGALGITRRVGATRWRRHRLLILCYHGISIEREHEWWPELYMHPQLLEERLEKLAEAGARVLPLGEALRRLREGTLPPRSVVLTFDDGGYDFYLRARPILERYGYPATVYLSTYYCVRQAPIFSLTCSYVLWATASHRLDTAPVIGEPGTLDLTDGTGRERALERMFGFASGAGLDDEGKQELLQRLSAELGIDYGAIRRKRLLHLMSEGEVAEVARAGFDIQLHTHRHRSPASEAAYREEVRTNRQIVRRLTGREPVHFCYPSGRVSAERAAWLRDEGIRSATTCRPGLADRGDDPLRLPRLVDHASLSAEEFEAWVHGLAGAIPGSGGD